MVVDIRKAMPNCRLSFSTSRLWTNRGLEVTRWRRWWRLRSCQVHFSGWRSFRNTK